MIEHCEKRSNIQNNWTFPITIECSASRMSEIHNFTLDVQLIAEPFADDGVGRFKDIYQEDLCDQGEWNSRGNFSQSLRHVYFIIKRAWFILTWNILTTCILFLCKWSFWKRSCALYEFYKYIPIKCVMPKTFCSN
jgi:hypothetical protein